LCVGFGIDKSPLSDVAAPNVREVKWTTNPDGSLSMPTSPSKQQKTGIQDSYPLMALSTQREATKMTALVDSRLSWLPYPRLRGKRSPMWKL
jgi:hypothetical protein